jgi:hypothetical protein
MSIRPLLHCTLNNLGTTAFVTALALMPLSLPAQNQSLQAQGFSLQEQGHAKTPVGKIFVVGVEGGAQVATGERIETLTEKSIFRAQGAQIETMTHGKLSLVFSNGTGVFLEPDTHIEVKRFSQEPFSASRTDLELEPSISHAEVFLSRGSLAVSTSKLAAGSTVIIQTWLGSLNLHGGDIVVESDSNAVKFFILKGEGTVQGGTLDLGGHVLHAGEQAVILPGPVGQPNIVQISKIPAADLPRLQEELDLAYTARKTVFFEEDTTGEVIAVPVVPTSLPVQSTVSPSRLPR